VADAEPKVLPVLRGALALRDASLVIYRSRTLVEFKTERLGGVSLYVEDGHASWQIGDFEDHHCHLDLPAVTRVLFSAEPVSCQEGRLNYTVWFLVDGDGGNPYRPDGYFSVTLNRPYAPDGSPRREVIEPVFQLFEEFSTEPWVTADDTFLAQRKAQPRARAPGP
jgi:hypothetical protein